MEEFSPIDDIKNANHGTQYEAITKVQRSQITTLRNLQLRCILICHYKTNAY